MVTISYSAMVCTDVSFRSERLDFLLSAIRRHWKGGGSVVTSWLQERILVCAGHESQEVSPNADGGFGLT